MGFLSEYYLWFLVGGIILVMALIGYVADKTDFGRKEISNKQNKKETEDLTNSIEVKQEVPVVEEKIVADEELPKKNTVIEEPVPENLNNDDNTNNDISNVDSIVTSDVDDVTEKQDVVDNVQIDDITEKNEVSNDENIEIEEVTDDSVFALGDDLSSFAALESVDPIGSADLVDNNVKEEVGEVVPTQTGENSDAENSDDSLVSQETDEDIWKF